MNKTKSKVLSLVLASAMIVSSFSSLNFASAASTRETGKLDGFTKTTDNQSAGLNGDDEIYLLSSDKAAKKVSLSALIGTPSITTYDHENAGAAEYDSYNHVSGDKLVTIDKNGNLTLKKDASGKEVITLTYKVDDYDRDDKEVTVKASKEITIFADKQNELFLAKHISTLASGSNIEAKKPGEIKTAAVNQKYLDFDVYYAIEDTGSSKVIASNADSLPDGVSTSMLADYQPASTEKYLGYGVKTAGQFAQGKSTGDAPTSGSNYIVGAKLPTLSGDNDTWFYRSGTTGTMSAVTVGTEVERVVDTARLDTKNDKIFNKIAIKDAKMAVTTSGTTTFEEVDDTLTQENTIRLFTTFEKEILAEGTTVHKDAKMAKTGTETLKIKLGKYVPASSSYDLDTSVTNKKVEVAKKWNADVELTTGLPASSPVKKEINKKNGKTYIANDGFDWDDKDFWKDNKNDATAVGSYDEIFSSADIKVLGGSVGLLDVDGSSTQTVTVEDGTVGDIKAKIVDIQGGSVGTIKDRATKITMSDGKVKAIDADEAAATISGGTVSGNVVVSSLDLDAEDDDINTVLAGNVTVKNGDTVNGLEIDSSGDASVTVKGTLKSEDQGGEIKISGDNVSLNVLDADYINDISFDDFKGSIKGIAAASEQTVKLEGESKVVLTNKLVADSVDIEEDSRLQVADARIGSIDGEGNFAFPAGKLFVEDGVSSDIKMELTEGLVAGATAFQSNEGAVTGSDVDGLGFTLETKSVNKTTDKHVIKAVSFAGPKFDKTDLTIAKGQSATVTVANYPDGTALPAGASVAYDVDVNDDFISVTQEGNVLTIKALDYNTSRSVDNKGTIKAYVVDANGDELDEDKYAEATLNVNIIEKPQSVVTVDTKTATVGTGAVYQYIAKSSTSAVMTATSSDTQVATVELFNAADPRGYKFQVKGLAVGTATITTTDANGATATMIVNVTKVNGTLKADTTSYTFAPGKAYDVKFSTTGTTAVPVVTVNGKVVSIAPRGNGVYRVTAQNPGTAYVVAKVGDTHVSVKFVVANGAAAAGVKGNNVSNLK